MGTAPPARRLGAGRGDHVGHDARRPSPEHACRHDVGRRRIVPIQPLAQRLAIDQQLVLPAGPQFGDDLARVRKAMESLAAAFEIDDLEGEAYPLYERFRPEIPRGKRGWGAKGALDLALIRSLADEA